MRNQGAREKELDVWSANLRRMPNASPGGIARRFRRALRAFCVAEVPMPCRRAWASHAQSHPHSLPS
jgi:hypothetical protein